MRFLQDQFLVGVTGIIFNDKKEILLFKHTYRTHSWSLPGGYLKSGEHPREALEREIKEESGMIVSADQELKVRTDRESARIDITVVGTYIGGEFAPSHEVSEYGFFDFPTFPKIAKSQVMLIHEACKERGLLTNGSLSKEKNSIFGKFKQNTHYFNK
jgi:ADP-ribose pyrophosphatase YjhB (NUDIX family)